MTWNERWAVLEAVGVGPRRARSKVLLLCQFPHLCEKGRLSQVRRLLAGGAGDTTETMNLTRGLATSRIFGIPRTHGSGFTTVPTESRSTFESSWSPPTRIMEGSDGGS